MLNECTECLVKMCCFCLRLGIRVDKSTDMMGSFAPSAEKTYEHPFQEDTVPDGMLARGMVISFY